MRPPSIHHCTSEPYRFFGRAAELALLDRTLQSADVSLIALVGPGGQGKTAIVQHWLQQQLVSPCSWDALFFWSFYRGKDVDVFLRQLHAYAEGQAQPAEVSASYCVDHLVPVLQRERWILILDGMEVVQHEEGPWAGRFAHAELGRLLEELASAPLPGVVLLTTRFGLPTLQQRRHARLVSLGHLDTDSARSLLLSLGVSGSIAELDEAARAAGWHAKGVELLGTWLHAFAGGQAARHRELPPATLAGGSDEERSVARVLAGFQQTLAEETCDILALATAFRQPPTESRLLEYLHSAPVETLLHQTWQRSYLPIRQHPTAWLAEQVDLLVRLRLLERVGSIQQRVLDTHPLVRRGFEHHLRVGGQRLGAVARAGFLSGRPDRRPPASLEEAREEVELFHAYCDAELWNEADSTLLALDNPKHRFLVPAFERDLLLRFFPDGDWRRPPLWPGFGRWRSLAICLEMLGQFEDALEVYRPADAGLRGDALIAVGQLAPLLVQKQVPAPWQTLWQAYRAHALCLAGHGDEALALVRTLVPVDIYEWVHVFECLLRTGQLQTLDPRSVLNASFGAEESRWSTLARRRMRADYLRWTNWPEADQLEPEYMSLMEAYDQAGLPFERVLVRMGYTSWLQERGRWALALKINQDALALAQRHKMAILEIEVWERIYALLVLHPGDASQAREMVTPLDKTAYQHRLPRL
jgi:tetratricopeptide (TPR) repeat protein